ncbi:MAG: hypothetical protein U5P10_13245 [Spirochaetia bacterium]|nr:hypothetical protein [Spirochaetia bacterium]
MGALAVFHFLPPSLLPLSTVVVALAAQLLWLLLVGKGTHRQEHRQAPRQEAPQVRLPEQIFSLLLVLGLAAVALQLPAEMGMGQYKTLAQLRRLEHQGDAEKVLSGDSPRMRLDVYEAKSLHQTLFAGPEAGVMAPPQLAVLYDGEPAGTIFQIEENRGARIMDSTPQSLAYRLVRSRREVGELRSGEVSAPRALLLGEVGGTNIWLGRRFGIEQFTVVQPSEMLIDGLKGPLRSAGGGVFTLPGVETVVQPPRLFLERRGKQRYDVIQLVSAEGMPAAGGGMQSLHEDYLVNREGIVGCLALLKPEGVVSITRGIQSPPRDNLKIFALFLDALEQMGVAEPRKHLLQARNYLAVTTMVSADPFDTAAIDALRRESRELGMDIEYYPGIESERLEQRNRIDGPPGASYSYYHHGAMQLTEGNREELFESWPYNIRPPTDQKPYFYNFFKWDSLGQFIRSYEGKFLQRMELGYVVLMLTLLEIVLVAFVLILLPLWIRRGRSLKGLQESPKAYRLPVLLHFGAIGFGFMFLEMVMIQKLGLFLGDPIYSASAVITAILLCAGAGSSLQGRIPLPPGRRIKTAAAIVVLLIVGLLFLLDPLVDLLFGFPLVIRYCIGLLILALPSFFMGWMLPSGMGILSAGAPDMVPWAWGINGFSSVAAGPLAVLISMEAGFPATLTAAALCYAAAGLTVYLWPPAQPTPSV